jgi:RNA polymerase sigma-70 factor (ECF subfamily)
MTFEEIFRLYREAIAAYITRMVGAVDADDVTQEVFTKIDRGLQRFRGQAKLSTWIYRIATNTALDRLRRTKRQRPEFVLMDEIQSDPSDAVTNQRSRPSSPLQHVIHTEMNDCIREQVDRLPEKYRTVMILSSLEELKNQEIADILDISVDNVKIRLHRARAMLKKILENQCRFYHNTDTGALSCDRKS